MADLTDRAGQGAPRPAGPPVEAPAQQVDEPVVDEPALVEVSVADWTAGYEAGWAAGHRAARTALDDAARALAALRPSHAVDVAQARTCSRPAAGEPDFNDPTALAAYRARIYASWGLPPPDSDEEPTP